MISVLIPVYNTDLHALVRTLSHQVARLGHPAEIIIWNDGSSPHFTQIISGAAAEPFVVCHGTDKNQGRTVARKSLAAKARYPWLLFIDADSLIPSDQFLLRYAEAIRPETNVIAGGRLYPSTAPDCTRMLHWKYGTMREGNWNKRPSGSKGFQTNNFLIAADLFRKIPDAPLLEGYGHEDTWLGMQLDVMHCSVQHIDNPVIHNLLHTANELCERARAAAGNLRTISHHADPNLLAAHSTLFRTYLKLEKWRLTKVFLFTYSGLAKKIRKRFLSCRPSLRAFDLYRLYLLAKTAS